MSKTCPACGAQIVSNPRDELLAHLQTKIKHSSALVEESEQAKPGHPFRLLESRIRRRDKYRSWVDFVDCCPEYSAPEPPERS